MIAAISSFAAAPRSELRAGKVRAAADLLRAADLPPVLLVDCSHANSGKAPNASQRGPRNCRAGAAGEAPIGGVMIESNLLGGAQDYRTRPLVYGRSITDPCLSFDQTAPVLAEMAGPFGRGGRGHEHGRGDHAQLRTARSPRDAEGQRRFGIAPRGDISHPRAGPAEIARRHRRDHALALELLGRWAHEARVLAALIDDPAGSPGRKWNNGPANATTGRHRCVLLRAVRPHRVCH